MDPSSLSNPNEAILKHLHWVVNVNFNTCTLQATATYDVELLSDNVTCLKLDTKYLVITSVSVENEVVTNCSLSDLNKEKEHLGQCLTIPLSSKNQKAIKVSIEYGTTSRCSALQWLPPAQTAGKVYPYLFTQCQAIHARSLVPCQDCPGVKMTYTAQITTPNWATCVMSAISTTLKENDAISTKETNTFAFEQTVPISSYLLAMAVGQLASHTISPRVQIWSEPEILPACAKEFTSTETFLKIAEDLTFDYVWKRYDLLCLPPSFPYGGMENPCLTFVTPTLLAGDGSLVDVVAHEIAHSWTGNLVTNKTWEHFWLNEGWTVWLQRKIMTRVKKDERFLEFDSISGWKGLKDSVELLPDKFTSMIPKLGDEDPDEAFSRVPYEKGFNLLYYLERLIGKEDFEAFAKAYLHKFKNATVTSYEFKDFFMSHFKSHEQVKEIDWDVWLHSPGMPPVTPSFDQSLASEALKLAEEWMTFDSNEDSIDISNAPTTSLKGWDTQQITCFLDALMTHCKKRKVPLKVNTIHTMTAIYKMGDSKNSEILSRFCQLAIAAGDTSIYPNTIQFITTQGRMKFVRPLYRALYQAESGKDLAKDTFLMNSDFYHPIAAKMLAVDMDVSFETLIERKKRDHKWIYAGLGVSVLFGLGLLVARRKR